LKYLIVLVLLLTSISYCQELTAEEFIWNFSVTITAGYERYSKEFEDSCRSMAVLELQEVKKEEILEVNGMYYIIKKPEPTFKGYIIWLNRWIYSKERENEGTK